MSGIDVEIIKIRHFRYGRTKDIRILADKNYFISESTYDQRIKHLKKMYDNVQPGSICLPPRQKTKDAAYRESIKYPIDFR